MRSCNRLGVLAWAGLCAAQAQPQIDWVQQVKNKPVLDARQYNFASQRPGGSLSAGACSFNLTPFPSGLAVGGSLYLSGGSGTAESLVLTGVSGNTVSGTCGFSHSGAWSAAPTTGGIQEAIHTAVAAGGGIVYVAPGTVPLRAAIQLSSKVTLAGAGQSATILQIANQALSGTPAWLMAGSPGSTAGSFLYCVICFAPGASYSSISNLTIDVNGANQSITLFSQDITGYNCNNCTVSDLTVKNHQFGITGSGIALWGHSPRTANANNLITRTTVIQQPNCSVPTAGGGYYIEGFMNRIVDTYALNACDTDYVVADCTHCSIVNGNSDLGSGQSATPVFTVAGLYNTVSDSHCTASGAGSVASCFEADNGPNEVTDGTVFMNNTADHCRRGFEVNNVFTALHTVTNTVFSGGSASCSGGNGVSIGGAAVNVLITGMTLHNSEPTFGAGIDIHSPAGSTVVSNVTITDNFIDHNHFGITVDSALADLIKYLTISGNFIGDTSGSPVEAYGVVLGTGLVTGFDFAHNTLYGATLAPTSYSNTWSNDTIAGPNIGVPALTFTAATLGTASTLGAGFTKYCSDCTAAATCVTGGSGHMATSNGSVWTCN